MLTMTKGDILELTNNAKRKAGLEAWNEWPVWADVPEIGLTVYKLDLPDGKAFTASWYAGDDFYPGGMAGNTNRPRFHLIGTGGSRFVIIGADVHALHQMPSSHEKNSTLEKSCCFFSAASRAAQSEISFAMMGGGIDHGNCTPLF